MAKKHHHHKRLIQSIRTATAVQIEQLFEASLCPRCGHPLEKWNETDFWGDTWHFGLCPHCGVEIGY